MRMRHSASRIRPYGRLPCIFTSDRWSTEASPPGFYRRCLPTAAGQTDYSRTRKVRHGAAECSAGSPENSQPCCQTVTRQHGTYLAGCSRVAYPGREMLTFLLCPNRQSPAVFDYSTIPQLTRKLTTPDATSPPTMFHEPNDAPSLILYTCPL